MVHNPFVACEHLIEPHLSDTCGRNLEVVIILTIKNSKGILTSLEVITTKVEFLTIGQLSIYRASVNHNNNHPLKTHDLIDFRG